MAGCSLYEDTLLAWVEGDLSVEREEALRRHAKECPACREEVSALDVFMADMEAIGHECVKDVPRMDLSASVMAAVSQIRAAEHPVVPITVATDHRFRHWFTRGLGLTAAAAALVLVFWASGYRLERNGQVPVAKTAVGDKGLRTGDVRPPKARNGAHGRNALSPQLDAVRDPAAYALYLGENSSGSPKGGAGALADVTVEDVLAMRKEADADARATISQWASLTMDKALQLINGGDGVVTKAEVGAARALPAKEAQQVLLAAVEADPNNPYLRYQLGAAYGATPENASKANEQFAAMATLDPDNALSLYETANSYFAQGDEQGGLNALQQASALDSVNAYTSEGAAYQAEALTASGAKSGVARVLAALTAGTSEYNDLVDLGNKLLNYGQYYEQSGETQTAQQIYEAVQKLGEQTVSSAAYSAEQLAGLDIERSAIDILSTVASYVSVPANTQSLTQQTQQLVQAFNQVGDLMNSINTFLQGADGKLLQYVANVILQNGDVNLFDYLNTSK